MLAQDFMVLASGSIVVCSGFMVRLNGCVAKQKTVFFT